eukprot:GHVP01021688.1.p1 GENE.GHVP01021688.1~~GHVP01021688.1.p1  ORF type:complete len:244 (+),score=30.16 GHVP01021688.1:22-753(+)
MICVHCGAPAQDLYQKYASGTFRLKICEHCKEVVDPLAEDDVFNVGLDLMLHKIEAFRHVLFNRFSNDKVCLRRDMQKFIFIIILVECYVKSFLFAGKPHLDPKELLASNYGFPLKLFTSCAISFSAYILGASIVCLYFHRKKKELENEKEAHDWNNFFAALIVGSYGKLGYFLMTIWDYELQLRIPISVFVTTSTYRALEAYYGSKYKLFPLLSIFSAFVFRILAQAICVWAGLDFSVSVLL